LTERAVVHVTGQLYLSVHTVKTHIRHVYTKLGAHGRREAVERPPRPRTAPRYLLGELTVRAGRAPACAWNSR